MPDEPCTPARPSPRNRMMGWVPLAALRCPAGHPMRHDSFVITDGGLWCRHKDDRHARECGKIMYVLAGPNIYDDPESKSVPQLVYVLEVTYREIREIQRRRLSVAALLEWLGAGWPVPTSASRETVAARA